MKTARELFKMALDCRKNLLDTLLAQIEPLVGQTMFIGCAEISWRLPTDAQIVEAELRTVLFDKGFTVRVGNGVDGVHWCISWPADKLKKELEEKDAEFDTIA